MDNYKTNFGTRTVAFIRSAESESDVCECSLCGTTREKASDDIYTDYRDWIFIAGSFEMLTICPKCADFIDDVSGIVNDPARACADKAQRRPRRVEPEMFDRARRAYRKYCSRHGLLFEQPSRVDSGYFEDGVYELRNGKGTLYKFAPTKAA